MKTIGIIGGKGLMGNFFAKFFRSCGLRILISDKNTALTNKQLARSADIVMVSVPIDATQKVIREIAPYLRQEQLFTDITSVKTMPVKEMLKSRASVIGLHPMFRPGPSGILGQTIVMCPARAKQQQKLWLSSIFKKRGAIITEMTPQTHDRLMGIIQVLIHFHSLVLGSTLRTLNVNLKELMTAMSPIYRMQFDVVCRIFAQNPIIYASIGMENPETSKNTAAFIKATEKFRQILITKNKNAFFEEFQKVASFLGPYSKRALKESDKLIKNLTQMK